MLEKCFLKIQFKSVVVAFDLQKYFCISVYAQNFMDKVEEIYGAENKAEKVTEFLHILQTFNQATDKVEELYYVRTVPYIYSPTDKKLKNFFN